MKMPDTNMWLALTLSGHTHHAAAKAWLDGESEPDSLIFCRATQQSFLRLMTTASVLAVYGIAPLSNGEAWDAYEAFIADSASSSRPNRRVWTRFGRISPPAKPARRSCGWMPTWRPSASPQVHSW